MVRLFLILLLIFSWGTVHSQVKIESVSFKGNNFFSTSDLMNSMVLRKDMDFDSTQFKYDRLSIREKYKAAGFLLSRIDSGSVEYNSDSSYAAVTIFISEGPQVKVGKVNVTGNASISKSEILNAFETKPGAVLSENVLQNDIVDLLALYESRGMPFAKAEIENIEMYNDAGIEKLIVDISVQENSRVVIDEVKIKGNSVTDDNVIIRELNLDRSKNLTYESLQEMKLKLEKLNIFDKVSDPKVYTIKNKNKSGLLIEVAEGNTNTFDGILGYVPPATDDDKGYFTGLINVSFRNLFGTGRRVDARWDQQVRQTQELQFNYLEPFFLSFPVNINAGFLQRIQDTTYTRRRIDLKADYKLSSKFTVSALVSLDRVVPSDAENLLFVIADSRTLVSGVEIKFDSRDNVYIPSKGITYTTSYAYGSKKIYNVDELQSFGYKSDYSIQKYSAQLELFHSFFKRQTSLLRFFGGEVRSDKLEDADFFRVGGINTIRGYREEQFLASKLAYGNFEFRYALSRKSFAFSFYDFGYYFRPEDVLNNFPEQKDFLYGYGIGLRLETGLGLISISYALGKGDTFLDGKIHFGLVNDF